MTPTERLARAIFDMCHAGGSEEAVRSALAAFQKECQGRILPGPGFGHAVADSYKEPKTPPSAVFPCSCGRREHEPHVNNCTSLLTAVPITPAHLAYLKACEREADIAAHLILNIHTNVAHDEYLKSRTARDAARSKL